MSDNSGSKNPLLSEILNRREGFILPDELSECAKLAEEISNATLPSEEEKLWLADFNKNVFRAITASNSLDYLVASRSQHQLSQEAVSRVVDGEHPAVNSAVPASDLAVANIDKIVNDSFHSLGDAKAPSPLPIHGQLNNDVEKAIPPRPGQTHSDEARPDITHHDDIRRSNTVDPSAFPRYSRPITVTPGQRAHITHPKTHEQWSSFNTSKNSEEYEVPNSFRIPPIKMSELLNRPEVFDGSKSEACKWIEDYERCALANTWDISYWSTYVAAFLKKSSRDWLHNIAVPKLGIRPRWSDFRSEFIQYYVGNDLLHSMKEELNHTRQRKDEPVTDFIPRVIRLMRMVNPDQNEESQTLDIKKKLTSSYQDRLVGQKFYRLQDLNDVCLEIEQRLNISGQKAHKQSSEHQWSSNKPRNWRQSSKLQSNIHYNNDKQSRRDRKDRGSGPIEKCTRCDYTGHTAEKCFAKTKRDGTKLDSLSRPIVVNKTTRSSKAAPVASPPSPVHEPKIVTKRNICPIVASVNDVKPLICPVSVGGKLVDAMIDTGSTYSLISESLAREIGTTIKARSYDLVGAGSTPVECLGHCTVPLSIRFGSVEKSANIRLVVVKNLCVPTLLGLDVMKWFRITVSPGRFVAFENEKKGVRLIGDADIPAWSQKTVVAYAGKNLENKEVLVKPFKLCPSLIVANSVSAVSDGKIECLIANISDKDKTILNDTQLASCEVLINHDGLLFSGAVLPVKGTDTVVKVGDSLNETQRDELHSLICNHIDAFSVAGELGSTNIIEHDIELLPNAKPIVEPLRRRPQIHKDETRKQVQEMLQKGVIERSDSPWASAYVVVKKKTGDLRICIDFRRLNDVTKKCSYPLPNAEDCLEPLAGNVYFTQLDLASGYWQIPLSERSKELTSFRTEDGQFHFLKMPFGLCNAPASFQRMVNALFSNLRGLNLQVFIDDICIANRNWNEHLAMLAQVFNLLIKANLKLKPSKCVFGAPHVIFLGHKLSQQGIEPDPEKVKAIKELPNPTSCDDVRRILGLLGYYRRMVPRFAEISAPLTFLLRKNAQFIWGDEQQLAFDDIKRTLIANPILANFNNHDPIALKTDASRKGIAGLILQRQDDEWRIITCASRRVNQHEENYGVSELEALAIVYAVNKFRNYLLGKHFTIMTDHCPLCALKLKNPSSARLRRWALVLSEFDYTIRYIKGSLHQDIDCLSRAPVDNSEDDLLSDRVLSVKERPLDSSIAAILQPIDIDRWRHLTREDEEAKRYIEFVRKRMKGYNLYSGLLYWDQRLYVPKDLRSEIMAENHDDSQAGHGGRRDTIDRLKQYWWPSLAEDVRNYVDSCEVCQRAKSQHIRPAGTMRSFEVYEPFELIAFDCIGPFPPSLSGKRQVIIGIDCFSRFIECEATDDIQAVTFMTFLKKYFGRYGPPKQILTDNSATFCNSQVAELVAKFHIEHKNSTPFHHEGNSMVERAIQSLRQKLITLTHDPLHSVDWEVMLPEAQLSVNTSYHVSIGMSPFKLLFGKASNNRSLLVNTLSSPQQVYANFRRLSFNENQRIAIARQFAARESSRSYFNQKHRELCFNIGDLVLARVMTRSKWQNVFNGPYRVVAKANDIYTIEGNVRREKLQRHVRDLRPFRQRSDEASDDQNLNRNSRDPNGGNNIQNSSVDQSTSNNHSQTQHSNTIGSFEDSTLMILDKLAILICAVYITSGYQWEPIPPILWIETNIKVAPAPTMFALQLSWGSPCGALANLQAIPKEDISRAITHCEFVYAEQLTRRLQKFVTLRKPMIHNYPPPGPQGNNLIPNRVPVTVNVPKVSEQNFPSARLPRQLGFTPGFITGAFVTNGIRTVMDRLWPNPAVQDLQDHQKKVDSIIRDLAQNENFSAIALQSIGEHIQLQAKLLAHQVEKVDHFASNFPLLTVVVSDIISKLHLQGSLLDKVRVSFSSNRPDLDSLSMLLDTTLLYDVDPLSVVRASVTFSVPNERTIVVRFLADIPSADTKVFQVFGFDYWKDLLGSPTLSHYIGPKFIVSNYTSNCTRGIDEPLGQGNINTVCLSRNYVDRRLKSWKPIALWPPDNSHLTTEVKPAWPYVYVNCYPLNISIEGRFLECPPHAFRLPADLAWETRIYGELSYAYEPGNLEFKRTNNFNIMMNVQKFHLNQTDSYLDLSSTLSLIRMIRKNNTRLREELVLLDSSPSGEITYKHLTFLLFGTLGLALIVVLFREYRRYKLVRKLAMEAARSRKLTAKSSRAILPRNVEEFISLRSLPLSRRVSELPMLSNS